MTLRIIAAAKIIITCQMFIGCVLFGLMAAVKVPNRDLKTLTYMLID
jgi:hypothetical protein